MKFKKLIALAIAALTLAMAFAPAALAVTNAPYDWSQWPVQGTGSYSTRYAYAVNRFLRLYYRNQVGFTTEYAGYYNDLINSDGKVIGTFSYATNKLVRKYQSEKGLTSDGAVGPYTWAAMRSSLYLTGYDDDGGYLFIVIDKEGSSGLYPVAYKFAPSGRWMVNRIDSGPFNYIYS